MPAYPCSCGPFVGYFKDVHRSPENSDDEEEGFAKDEDCMPKDYGRIHHAQKDSLFRRLRKARRAVLKKGADDPVLAARGWNPYLTIVTTTQTNSSDVTIKELPAVKVNSMPITKLMMSKLTTLSKCHTIEIISCHLKDIPMDLSKEVDNLHVLRVSQNDITRIRRGSFALDAGGKQSKLEELTADHNKINFIEPNCFGHEDVCANLTIMNLSHNELEFLPNDFLTGAQKLQYLDLSHNRLQMIPDTVLDCGELLLLYLGQNQLTKLPDHIERLVKLRKLFISHNKLTTLPDKIGECKRLVKLRVVHNKIRMMPASILDLWKERGGRLEELLVDNNPMVQPSITAFTMGGMNQAFHLFEEWLKTEDLRKKQQDGQVTQLALPSGDGGVSAKGGKRKKSVNATRQVEMALAIPDGDPDARGGAIVGFAGVSPRAEDAPVRTMSAKSVHDDVPPMEDLTQSFHFLHVAHDPAAVADIRSAEVSLLFMKKSMWIELQRKLAKEKAKEARSQGKEVPKHLNKFLEDDFKVENFSGRINVSDLDMFFIMLVFVSKPMFSSAKALFDKFNTATDDFMTKAMFNNLVRRLPVKVPHEITEQIWGLLNWRDSQSDQLSLVDFVAGWHTHDIEEDDVWVTHVCKSLNLDFYEMDVPELQDRVKAKGSEEASPVLMFPDGDESESSSDAAGDEPPDLPLNEGERMLAHRVPQLPQTYVLATGDEQLEGIATPRHEEQEVKPAIIVSMDDEEYLAKDAANDREEEESLMSDNSIGSDKLSKESDTEESDFEAQEICKRLEESSDTEVNKRPDAEASRTKFEVKGDEDLAKLMNMSPEEILWEPPAHTHTGQIEKPKDEKKSKGHKLENKNNIRESRFHTDVFTVRIALREMHRNLPKSDFKKFVDFILRGLRNMKHSNAEDITYWHAEDPTFKSCVASNPYTIQLLEHMGFVCLNDVFWVWPSKHLNFSSNLGLWGNRMVSKRCPGRNIQRLDDMVALLRQCQRCLIRDGSKFNGHLRS